MISLRFVNTRDRPFPIWRKTDMTQTIRTFLENPSCSRVAGMTKEEVRARIEETGVIPSLRGCSAADAAFAANALAEAGIPLVEVAVNVPGAVDVLSQVLRQVPNVIVGAGRVTSMAIAEQCLKEGARFLTTDALILPVLESAARHNAAVIPGAFTPTEIVAAWNSSADFVKVFPCDAAGGHNYIRSVKTALPDVPLIAAGGVTQATALSLVSAGATGIGVGRELVPEEAIRLRQTRRIQELARRFLSAVDNGRINAAGLSS